MKNNKKVYNTFRTGTLHIHIMEGHIRKLSASVKQFQFKHFNVLQHFSNIVSRKFLLLYIAQVQQQFFIENEMV